jgi:hypothetical protein
MRSAKFIAVCLIGCIVTGCAMAIGCAAAIGCAVLYERAFHSSINTLLFFVLMSLLALPNMWAGMNAVKFHRLVRWAAG